MSLTKDGGKPAMRDVNNYRPPVGPASIGNRSVGLGGTNFGNCQCMDDGTPRTSGSVSAGMNHSNSPTQGKR